MFPKLNFFLKIAFAFQVIVFIVALLSYFAPYVSPSLFWLIAILGLTFPIVFILQIILFLIWLVVKRRIALFCFIFLLGALPQLLKNVPFNSTSNAENKTQLSILTFNVKVFDLYNWKKNKESIQSFKDYLQEQNADIICFQEFFSDDENEYINAELLQKELNYKHSFIHYTKKLNGTQNWGIAIFSKYKIINADVINFENKANNGAQFVDVVVKKDTLRIFNTHLQSIHFSANDYELVDKLKSEQSAEIKGTKRIVARLKKAFLKREIQINKLVEKINESNLKTIVCGDFNDTPNSYTYAKMSSILNDCFLQAGKNLGTTYNGNIPFLRIDYIFADKRITSQSFTVDYNFKLSDHFPVKAILNL